MATVIDELIVRLGLDSSSYDAGTAKVDRELKDTGDQADKTAGKVRKVGEEAGKTAASGSRYDREAIKRQKEMTEGYRSMAGQLVKFLAIIGGTGAVKRFVEQTVESNAALGRFAQNLQQSVSQISAWSNAVETVGGTAGGLQNTLDMLSQAQTELMLTGESRLIPFFSALGISVADMTSKAKAGADILLSLADRFSKMDRTTAFNMGRMMGIDAGTLNLILQGRQAVELMIKRQREANAVTQQQAEQAMRLQRAMVENRQSFEAFGRELLSDATPALESLLGWLAKVGDWMRDNKEFVKDALVGIAIGIGAIVAASIPISGTVAAVVGLTTALAALWQDYQVWKRGGETLIPWDKWEPGIEAAKKGLTWIRDLLEDIFFRAFGLGDVLAGLISADAEQIKRGIDSAVTGNRKPYGGAPKAEPSREPITPSEVIKFFRDKGWTEPQARGIAANLMRESGMNPGAVGDSGKAYGLAQWHPDRQAEFLRVFGKSIRDATAAEQLEFIQYEMTQGKEQAAGAKLREATTPQEAAKAVMQHYERPANQEKEAKIRADLGSTIGAPPREEAENAAPGAGRQAAKAATIMGGIPGAAMAAEGAGAAQAAGAAATPASPAQSVSKSVETHIGEISIYTQATDAQGITADLGRSLNYLFASNANAGLA